MKRTLTSVAAMQACRARWGQPQPWLAWQIAPIYVKEGSAHGYCNIPAGTPVNVRFRGSGGADDIFDFTVFLGRDDLRR